MLKTNELMKKYGITAKKNFGQNFIMDQNIINKLVSLSMVNDNSTVIEIGPGLGILTAQLAKTAKKVIAYEIDDRLVKVLPEILQEFDNVTINHRDFLEVNIDQELGNYSSEELVVCANLPYYITTPILFKIFEANLKIKYISVMMQKEVADRFNAEVNSKDYNALSVITSYKYESKMILKIPRTVFNPAPNVDSAVVLFTRKEANQDVSEVEFFKFVKVCFKQRRKTLYNNLREIASAQLINDLLEDSNINLKARAQELTLEDFIGLFKNYEKKSIRKN